MITQEQPKLSHAINIEFVGHIEVNGNGNFVVVQLYGFPIECTDILKIENGLLKFNRLSECSL